MADTKNNEKIITNKTVNLEEEKLYKEEELVNFVDNTIYRNKCFTKEYTYGNMLITFRTRTMKETKALIEFQNTFKTATSMLHNLCMATLGYTLVKINETMYDKGSLQERIDALEELSPITFKILVDKMEVFNKTVDQMAKDFDLFYKAP